MPRGINVARLAQQVGIEELGSIDRQEQATDFMSAAITGLADGDIMVLHTPYTGKQAELYGENHYGDGRVAKAIGRAAIENDMNRSELYDFQEIAAQYFAEPNSPFQAYKTQNAVQVYPKELAIDDNLLDLKRTPSLVIDYGACLTGRSLIANQIAFLDGQGDGLERQPFVYMPVTRLHFTNLALMSTYDTIRQGTAKAMMDRRFYIGREDGIAAATNEAIRAQRSNRAPVEVADIVICSGVQHTTPTDLKQGIPNAYTLLREGGVLVVRSLARPASDELGTEEMVGWALDAGFQESNVIRYEADIDKIGTVILTGHFGERQIQTAVLTK